MDDYRKALIDLVRDRPLIWDPKNKDYKNKDQRRQVWEHIDTTLKSPTGEVVSAKEIWDHLSRSFCNAIKRKSKRSGSGAENHVKWKFEDDMMFLLPVKRLRPTTGNMRHESVLPAFEDATPLVEEQHREGPSREGSSQDREVSLELEGSSREEDGMQIHRHRKPSTSNKRRISSTDDDTKTILSIIKEWQLQKKAESPRLGFFRSLMPVVDSYNDRTFMAFQMDVIKLAQRYSDYGQPQCYTEHQSTPSSGIPQPKFSYRHDGNMTGAWSSSTGQSSDTNDIIDYSSV